MLECFLVLHVCSYCSCVNNYLPGHMQVLINIAKYEHNTLHYCRSWISEKY